MGIPDEDVAKVKAATDLVGLISETVALRRVGRRFVGLCPFHAEKTPSFNVNPELGRYHCFGCQQSGDAITWLREIQHLDFADAVEVLGSKAGITVRREEEGDGGKGRRHRTALLDALEQAATWYHERLLAGADARAARDYLRSRGISGEDARRFRIGWAPDAWDELARALRLPDDVAVDSGLAYRNANGRQTDAFRARLLFPILDTAGRVVAFGGRVLPGSDVKGPKYKNSPETPVYRKSSTLYALSWAKTGIVGADEVVVCEGYTDVIGCFQAGVPRAVATCGTALTEDHVKLLRGFARRLVLAYDADSAGQAAAERFYAWEQRYELDIRVAALPAGADPAEVAREDPGALAAAIAGARPFLEFRLDRVLSAADLSTAEGRARAAEHAIDVVREHPSDLVRDQYVMVVGDRCRVDPDRLRSLLAERPRRPAATAAARGAEGRGGRRGDARPAAAARDERWDEPPPSDDDAPPWADDGPPHPRGDRAGSGRAAATAPGGGMPRDERNAVRFALHHREAVLDLLGDVAVVERFFEDPRALDAIGALWAHPDPSDAIASAGPEAAMLLEQLAVEEPEGELEEVMGILAEQACRRLITEVQGRLRQDPSAMAELVPITSWLRLCAEDLLDPETRGSALGQLVPWLSQWGEEIR